MDVSVALTDSGDLQVTVDGVTWAPLPPAAVKAMADMLPAAQAANRRQVMTSAIRMLTDVLVSSGPGITAAVTVSPTAVTASLDDAAYSRAQEITGATPDATGVLRVGPVEIRKNVIPSPVPEPTPDPPAPAEASS